MEYIVAREEKKPEEAIDRIVIPQLVTLYLHNVPKSQKFRPSETYFRVALLERVYRQKL